MTPDATLRRLSRIPKAAWEYAYINRINAQLSRSFPPIEHAEDAPTILIATCYPGIPTRRHWTGPVESLIGKHLELARGLRPVYVLYDRWRLLRNVYRGFGHRYYRFLPEQPIQRPTLDALHFELDGETLSYARVRDLSQQEVTRVAFDGIPVGRLAMTSARREVQKSKLDTPRDWATLWSKLDQGLVSLYRFRALLDALKPVAVLTNHTTYIEYGGLYFREALARKMPVTSWQGRSRHSIVARRFTSENCDEDVSGLSAAEWERLCSSPQRDAYIEQARQHIEQRRQGAHVALPGQPETGVHQQPLPPSMLGLDMNKPAVGVFAHLPWDAIGAFYTDLFPSVKDWLEYTMRVALDAPEINWIFRVHPSERLKGSAEDTAAYLHAMLPAHALHVRIVGADVPLSSYNLLSYLKGAVTVRGTLAVEMPCFGVRTICAGTGQTSHGGYNEFPASIEAYAQALRTVVHRSPLSEAEVEEALLLAYGHFISRPIRFECVEDFSLLQSLRAVTPEAICEDRGLQRMASLILDTGI